MMQSQKTIVKLLSMTFLILIHFCLFMSINIVAVFLLHNWISQCCLYNKSSIMLAWVIGKPRQVIQPAQAYVERAKIFLGRQFENKNNAILACKKVQATILAKNWLASQWNLHFNIILVTLYLKINLQSLSVQFKRWFNEHYFVTKWCQAITWSAHLIFKIILFEKKYSQLGPCNIRSNRYGLTYITGTFALPEYTHSSSGLWHMQAKHSCLWYKYYMYILTIAFLKYSFWMTRSDYAGSALEGVQDQNTLIEQSPNRTFREYCKHKLALLFLHIWFFDGIPLPTKPYTKGKHAGP